MTDPSRPPKTLRRARRLGREQATATERERRQQELAAIDAEPTLSDAAREEARRAVVRDSLSRLGRALDRVRRDNTPRARLRRDVAAEVDREMKERGPRGLLG